MNRCLLFGALCAAVLSSPVGPGSVARTHTDAGDRDAVLLQPGAQLTPGVSGCSILPD